eukprot:TRINITY_DN5338_c0_g1_i3.p1 TRINITY_DN5338_c0_g1~~TRINITY_DN5338_c0_g1_i3.p1  ORF type:complete len:153 (+),score=7.11 TRINITY_DN5338_c0_g1_i3:27-485(+)
MHPFTQFPSRLIKKKWNENKKIRYVAFCNGMWLVISEESRNIVKQTVVVKSQLPTDELRKIWRQGKKVSLIAYGSGKWVIISEPDKKSPKQSFYASTSNGFPRSKIKDFYSQKLRIHSMVHADKEDTWALIVEPRSDSKALQRVQYLSLIHI